MSHPSCSPLPTRCSSSARASRCLTLLLAFWLTGCSTLQALPHVAERPAQGSWLELTDEHRLQLSPGVFLDLPDAPYRARFADKEGVYFQASRPLQFRTQHGFVNEAEGGLYMRYDRPGLASTWYYPSLGAPATPYGASVKIQYFPAQY